MENRSISKRAIKISAVVLAVSIAVGFILTSIYLGWALRTRPRLDTDRLSSLNHSVTFVCSEGQSITGESIGIGRVPVSLEQVSPYFLDALIVKEDKNFYKHKGVDFRRIVGASVDNIRARTFKEGASTLSQQLIKNTHLSPQKTFTRKIQELSLARKLEREFSKQQILQMYINAIYFGEGSYGIEAAALSYFGKNASCLTLVEAASLASIIRAPNALSPRRCLEVNKRETKFVLTQMFLADKICFTKYQYAKSQDVITKSLQHSPHRSYLLSALNEASKKLGVSQAKLLKQNYKIYTNLCRQTQLLSHNALLKDSFQVKVNATNGDTADALVGVICNHTGRVKAFASKSKYNLTNMRRSPASTIKPVLVYAPAIEHGIISPASTILDQHTNFNGYAPTNFRGTQEGYVSVRHSIKRSLNIPAVKTLNYLGVENAYYYATQINIHLDENDKSLALSLGGLTRGITPLQLANAYVPFANGGTFIEAHFVNKITSGETNNKPRRNFNNNSKYNNHKILYEANPSAKKIYSDCTAYLMTDILRETAQSGTARRLANLNFDVAAKTGTAGTRTFNTDIWNVSYTSADTIVVWLGNASGSEANNLPVRTGGGGIPTFIARYILANKASKSGTASKNITTEKNAALSPPTPPPPFVRPTSVIELEIDKHMLEQYHKVVQAHPLSPTNSKIKELFSVKNLPPSQEHLSYLNLKNFDVSINNSKPQISFYRKSFVNYKILRECLNNSSGANLTKVAHLTPNCFETPNFTLTDKSATSGNIYKYSVIPYLPNQQSTPTNTSPYQASENTSANSTYLHNNSQNPYYIPPAQKVTTSIITPFNLVPDSKRANENNQSNNETQNNTLGSNNQNNTIGSNNEKEWWLIA